jgi:hypothetical protein
MSNFFKIFKAVRQMHVEPVAHTHQGQVRLSPTTTRLLNKSQFSSDEINRAFAEARRVVSST